VTEQAPPQFITAPPAVYPGSALRTPGFLRVPLRTVKPRTSGLLHVLDDGMSLAEARQHMDAAGPVIDIWKFGWGTAYIDQNLAGKLDLLARHGVRACTGGTLLEIAWEQGAVTDFFNWAQAVGFPCVEVSCGTVTMTRREKSGLISAAAERFSVLAEIGRKDATSVVFPRQWAADAQADLSAGADYVITEGRESGTAGLYEPDGSVRASVADAVVSVAGTGRVLFEAPQHAQQTWLVRRYGANVNLGNVRPAAALSVEALRLGLRSDTVDAVAGGTFAAGGADRQSKET
jgi:phosphosulfolactate synthase